MSKYIVKLIPTGRFFFGGDMTFELSGQAKHNEKFSSYIIRSLKFPQQTSLLGMLRFLLLSNDQDVFESDKIKDTGKAEALIGKKSFTINEPNHEANKFGKIQSVGTCCLCKGNEYYYQAPFDYDWTVKVFESIEATLNGKPIRIPAITVEGEEYTSKKGIHKCYLSKQGHVLEDETVFLEDSRIGIRKGKNGKAEEEAFYKQIGYRLKDDCCFAFNVEIDDLDLTKYTKQLVSVGADSSMFIIQIEKGSFDLDLPSSYQVKNKDWEKVVLLADTYLPETDMVEYAISETKPFRFIKTTVDNKNYHIMYGLQNKSRSDRYNLFAAGSVFLVKDAKAFKDIIKSKEEFLQIGYNHCK